MSRRRVIQGAAGLGLALAGAPLGSACSRSEQSAREAPAVRVYRIGWLYGGGPPASATTPDWDAPLAPSPQRLVDRLAELGYVEGRTVRFELRRASTADELAAHAAALVELGVDLLFLTSGPQALRAAFEAPGSTPVVMGPAITDPVGLGYAQSLARPGGRLTGVTAGVSAAVAGLKQVEVFKEALPTLARLGVLVDVHKESTYTVERVLARFTPTARELGFELVIEEVRALEELDGAFAAMARAGVDGVFPQVRINWQGGDPPARIIADALRHRLPMCGGNRRWTEVGALVEYSRDVLAIYARTAEYVDKVLRGARPGDIPIENPEKYELTINACTAQKLGLTIPPAVLVRATEVIQCP